MWLTTYNGFILYWPNHPLITNRPVRSSNFAYLFQMNLRFYPSYQAAKCKIKLTLEKKLLALILRWKSCIHLPFSSASSIQKSFKKCYKSVYWQSAYWQPLLHSHWAWGTSRSAAKDPSWDFASLSCLQVLRYGHRYEHFGKAWALGLELLDHGLSPANLNKLIQWIQDQPRI